MSMHFHKYPHPFNFEFIPNLAPNRKFRTQIGGYRFSLRDVGDEIYHFQFTGKHWEKNDSQSNLRLPSSKRTSKTDLQIAEDGRLKLVDEDGSVLLESKAGRLFGQSAEASIFEFVRRKGDQFYGLGEKWTGFEHSGKTTKFWNTDVWADFNPDSYIHGRPAPDPVYVSIPYLILKRGNTYLGFLLDNPHATFISTGFSVTIANQMEVAPGTEEFAEVVTKGAEEVGNFFHLGAEAGQPNLYILVGPSLSELTKKVQNLMGTTPLPPAWALGYHQCRWGYESASDLLDLDAKFRKHEIPVDGLWLDIDYMDGYRVFTFAAKHFPDPKKAMRKLAQGGRKVVPILDPGVKHEAGYSVYDRGQAAKAYCRNPQGGEYIGLVWPGQTVFPDFSIDQGRDWWSKEVADFASHGIHGAWLDMNDPATGPVENKDMMFDQGRQGHGTFHNQYGLGMAMATREGFLAAHPNERPFLLSRSGFTGSNRYTAIWTGDNYSNYYHLKNSVATTLNLALSGIPFNGPDMGGFGGDTHPALIEDWYKAGFLFPVMRNHSMRHTRQQEPWALGRHTQKVLSQYIRLRYRLRPYLYQLFVEQERSGDAILRPLFYEFADSVKLPLGLIDDQFMVGPDIMQAPFLEEKLATRKVVLPKASWFDLSDGVWRKGGKKIMVEASKLKTPIYVRDGSILPLARLDKGDHTFSGARADFHVFISGRGAASSRYYFDDGRSFAYRDGQYSEFEIRARKDGSTVSIEVEALRELAGPGDFTFTIPTDTQQVLINGQPARRVAAQGVQFGSHKSMTWAC